jgi:hypothetical protein
MHYLYDSIILLVSLLSFVYLFILSFYTIVGLTSSLFSPLLQRTLAQVQLLASPSLTVRLVTCRTDVSRAAERIFIKFRIEDCCKNLSTRSNFGYNRAILTYAMGVIR